MDIAQYADLMNSTVGRLVGWGSYVLACIGVWVLVKRKESTERDGNRRFNTMIPLALPLLAFLQGYWYFNLAPAGDPFGPIRVLSIEADYPEAKLLTLLLIVLTIGSVYLSLLDKRLIILAMVTCALGVVLLGSFAFRMVPSMRSIWGQLLGTLGFFISFWTSLSCLRIYTTREPSRARRASQAAGSGVGFLRPPDVAKLVQEGDVDGLVRALDHEKDPSIPVAAAKALGDLGDARAVEPLATVLGYESGNLRGAAASALGQIGDARAVEPLLASLEGEYAIRRRQTMIEALGQIGDLQAVEALVGLLDDRHVGEAASRALHAITGQDFGLDASGWQNWWTSQQ
jgi:hypothetical protein